MVKFPLKGITFPISLRELKFPFNTSIGLKPFLLGNKGTKDFYITYGSSKYYINMLGKRETQRN